MAIITCIDCGVDADRDGNGAIRCLPCANKSHPRIASADRKMNVDRTVHRIGGVIVCKDCHTPINNTRPDGSKYRPTERCVACSGARSLKASRESGQQEAHRAIAMAVASGAIPRAAELDCADCGKKAQQYDHRDYGRPLDVQPVCRSCNLIRGNAIWRNAQPMEATK